MTDIKVINDNYGCIEPLMQRVETVDAESKTIEWIEKRKTIARTRDSRLDTK